MELLVQEGFRTVSFQKVVKPSTSSYSSTICFRTVSFQKVVKPLDSSYDRTRCFRTVSFQKVVKLSQIYLCQECCFRTVSFQKVVKLESVHGYLEYMELKNGTDIDLKDEKIKEETKKIKKDIELKSLRISELKSQLHSAENVKKVMNNMLANIRGKLLALSNKLAPSVIACDNLGEIQDIIHTNILVALDELSNYDAETFKNNILLEEELEEEE